MHYAQRCDLLRLTGALRPQSCRVRSQGRWSWGVPTARQWPSLRAREGLEEQAETVVASGELGLGFDFEVLAPTVHLVMPDTRTDFKASQNSAETPRETIDAS